jgi:serine/threonine-protein kinase
VQIRFGKYLVEDDVKDELGKGGFGRVYRAFNRDLNLHVAIKVLKLEGDSELLGRFQAEAALTARLKHGNIVIVHEFGHQDGAPYLVMELLEGQTLKNIIDSNYQLPLLEKVEIMRQVAEGLKYAHARGVIHRDIKPANVMVLPDGTVKIMDFGIARVMQRADIRYTREGDLIGTIAYMAPELFQTNQPSKRTDIFAYGVLYYELLTREHPFRADDPYAVMRRIQNEDPMPLLRATLPTCPPDLVMLLQHLLAKDPNMRFEEFGDVLFDTEPILRSLRQERAATLAKEVEPLLKAGDYDGASSRVKQILDLDSTHERARAWHDQIRTRLKRQRADKLRYDGLEHMSALRFKDAVVCFESALQLDTCRSDIASLLNEAKAAVERLRQSAELINNARADRQSGKLEEAFSKISRAIELDSANRDALSMRDSLRRQIRELRMNNCLTKAEALRKDKKFDAALAVLEELEPDLQAQSSVKQIWERLLLERKQHEQEKRNAEFAEALKQARILLERGSLAEAVAAASNLCSRFPEQHPAYEFRVQAQARLEAHQRSEAVRKIIERTEKLAEDTRFEEAKLAVSDGLNSYSDEPRLTALAKRMEELAAAHLRASNIRRALDGAAALSEEGDFARAIELVEKEMARLGTAPEFSRCLADLREKHSQQQYVLNIERLLAQSQFLLEAGRTREALTLLEKADPQYKKEPRIYHLLQTVREQARQEETQRLVQDALHRSQLLENQAHYTEALTVIDQAASRYGRTQELENAAVLLKQKLEEQKQQENLRLLEKRMQTAIQREDWASATETLHIAQEAFPGHHSFSDCPTTIENGKRQTDLKSLGSKCQQLFSQNDLDEAEQLLNDSKIIFSNEAIWISCRQELTERKSAHLASLSAAQESAFYKRPNSPPSSTPAQRERPKGDTRETDRINRDRQILEGQQKAAALAQEGDLPNAIKVLEKLIKRYPNSSDLHHDLMKYQRQAGPHEEHKDKGLTGRIRNLLKGRAASQEL